MAESLKDGRSSAEADYALERLQAALRFNRFAPALVLLSFVIRAGTVGLLLAILAIAFTPYLLGQLWRAKWIRAIVIFAMVVLGPAAWAVLADTSSGMRLLLAYTIPILLFYLYVWGLYLAIASHLAERERERTFGFGSDADVA